MLLICCEVKFVSFKCFVLNSRHLNDCAKSACLTRVVNLVALTVLIMRLTQMGAFECNVNRDYDFQTPCPV